MGVIQETETISAVAKWDGTNWHQYKISTNQQLDDRYVKKTGNSTIVGDTVQLKAHNEATLADTQQKFLVKKGIWVQN